MPTADIQILDDPRVLERIRILDKYCFPVKYSEDYYENAVGKLFKGDPERHWTPINNIALYSEMLVGSITSRLENMVSEEDPEHKELVKDKFRCYIMTLGVLEPYRHLGIATRLVKRVIEYVSDMMNSKRASDVETYGFPSGAVVEEVGLHVQQGSPALDFYKKLGFEIRYEVKNYYTDIEPTLDAFYVSKKIVKQ